MTEAVQLALIAIVVPTLTAFGVLYVAIQTRREAREAADLLKAETAAVKVAQDEADKKLSSIGKATDGTLSALKSQNDTLTEANRRLEQVISTFTVVQAAIAVVPPPAITTVTNGREEPPAAALAQGPIAVFTVPGSSVAIAADDPVPVSVVPDPGTDDETPVPG